MMEEVHVVCAGINHQTWFIQVIYDGRDWCDRLLEGYESHPVYRELEKVRIDMLKRFGCYSTESNGHLSEYVPWYRKRLEDVTKWIDTRAEFIHGETGGYLRCCVEGHRRFQADYRDFLTRKMPPIGHRSGEHGSYIIEGLETGRLYRGHFNVPNDGCITNLPDDAIVEVPGYVDRNGINIPQVGDLPLGCAAVCNASITVQRLAVEAAVHGDVMLLKQAMMMDPLVGAVCDPNEISQMTDEMLIAQAKWLPQYKHAIPAARKRLACEKSLAWYKGRGAARVKPRTVSQMRRNAEKARAATARKPRKRRGGQS